jgi:rhodanese-related sulfurtransferase
VKLGLFLTLAALATLPSSALAQDSFGGAKPQPQPQQGGYPASPYGPAPAANTGGADLDKLMAVERQDFGVKPTSELHSGPMHGPTPNSIPGGQVITTKGLVALLGNQQLGAKIFDILGGPDMIPGAVPAVPAAQAGSFSDQTQQEFGQYLQQVTGGNKQTPLVFYCLSSHCWMSYNASLRAINMGFQNVLWYRGGIEAWKAAGQQTQPAGQPGRNQ